MRVGEGLACEVAVHQQFNKLVVKIILYLFDYCESVEFIALF